MFIDFKLPRNDERAPKRDLKIGAPVEHPARTSMNTQWLVAVQQGDARRGCDHVAFLGAHRLRTIDQPARPDAPATRGLPVDQPKPLGASAASRAYEHRPKAAVWELPHPHADLTGFAAASVRHNPGVRV
jgi:hypothetical protein